MVTIKEATRNAMEFAVEALGEKRTIDMRLEEVESVIIDGQDFLAYHLEYGQQRCGPRPFGTDRKSLIRRHA